MQRHRGAAVDLLRLQLDGGEVGGVVVSGRDVSNRWRGVGVALLTVCVWFRQPSVFELVRRPDFANLPLVVEDFVKDYGGSYTGEPRTSQQKVINSV